MQLKVISLCSSLTLKYCKIDDNIYRNLKKIKDLLTLSKKKTFADFLKSSQYYIFKVLKKIVKKLIGYSWNQPLYSSYKKMVKQTKIVTDL